MEYLDFELEIGPGEGRDYPVAVVRSPAGAARGNMHFPFDDLALESRLKDLQIALLRSGGQRRRVPSPQERAVQDFGQALFQAALSGRVRERYDASLQEARRAGKGLRLKLEIRSPQLAALPWEFLYDPGQAEYVCLCSDTPIVRYLELPRPVEPLSISPPLRILGMTASPGDLPPLNIGREKQRVEESLQELRAEGLVELTWLDGSTWRHLMRMVRRQGPWHIFYFMGHGGFDRVADEGYIALADEYGETHRLTATQLGRVLADHLSLQLAVLNSCEGGAGSEHDIFSSTAAILVRRGVPAVLAMQYEITDRAAIEFTRTFFESLADGFPVDASVTEARKAISLAVSNTVEWGTPVLYVRSSGSVLFSLRPAETAAISRPAPAPVERPPEPEPRPAHTPRQAPRKKKPQIIGIDLGITNTSMAVYQDGRPSIIPNLEGESSTPSAVTFSSDAGQLVAGRPARQLSTLDNAVFPVVRFVGCRSSSLEVQKAANSVRCEIRPAADKDISVRLGSQWYTATEALAVLFSKLKRDAEAYLNAPVVEAVIALPTLFDQIQRQAIIQAARAAGMEPLRLLGAPAAIVLANEWKNIARKPRDLAACHMGGSTTGIAVANVGDGVCAIGGYSGDAWLGGDDLDRRIVNWLARKFQEREGIDLLGDPHARQRMREAAEAAKIELSSMPQAEINLPYITADSSGPKHLNLRLTRSELEGLARDLVERLTGCCRQVLQDTGDPEKVDGVLLGGGMTCMPMIQKVLDDVLASGSLRSLDPHEAVALGAAVQAGVLGGQVSDLLLLDAVPLSFAVETLGGVATTVVHRGATLPVAETQTFSTAGDNQTQVEIHVVQGERPMAADNRSLGKFILDGIPAAPQGVPQIEVTYDVDPSGLLHVSAREKTTGKEMSVRI